MEVEEESQEYLTINTHQGLYRYNGLVFGISNLAEHKRSSLRLSERNKLHLGWHDYQGQGSAITTCPPGGIRSTEETEGAWLTSINREKCTFFQEKIIYRGHVVDQDGLHETQEKVDVIVHALRPENVRQVRSFLRLVNYYHKFFLNLITIPFLLNFWNKAINESGPQNVRRPSSKWRNSTCQKWCSPRMTPDISMWCFGIVEVLPHIMEDCLEKPIAFALRAWTKVKGKVTFI